MSRKIEYRMQYDDRMADFVDSHTIWLLFYSISSLTISTCDIKKKKKKVKESEVLSPANYHTKAIMEKRAFLGKKSS